jgi:putative ABC transport system substrate-binding protein
MRRREFIAFMGASATWPFAAIAQEPGRKYRLGVLQPFPRESPTILRLLDELRRSGFVEGRNLTIDYRHYGLQPDVISEYAADLVRAGADVLDAVEARQFVRYSRRPKLFRFSVSLRIWSGKDL